MPQARVFALDFSVIFCVKVFKCAETFLLVRNAVNGWE